MVANTNWLRQVCKYPKRRLEFSEVILQGKLNLPQLNRRPDPSKTRRRRRTLRSPTRARTPPRRMIRSIEHLHPELQRVALPNPEILHRREIHVPRRRPKQIIPAAIP